MDPSYNNSFGNFGAGGVPGGAAPITSGTGDIVLQPAQKKRSRKWIVVVALILVFAIAGVVTWLVLGRVKGGGGTESVPVNNLQEAVNSYANYVLYGKNSVESVDVSTANADLPYFRAENLSDKYFEVEKQKYDLLNEMYSAEYDDLDLSKLDAYFYELPRFDYTVLTRLRERAEGGDLDGLKSAIESEFLIPDGSDGNFVWYIESSKKYMYAFIDYAEALDLNGCNVEKPDVDRCRGVGSGELDTMNKMQIDILTSVGNMQDSAMAVLTKLVDGVYE